MVYALTLKIAIIILRRAVVALKDKASESSTVMDDLALEALEGVIALYESGELARLIKR